MKRLKILIILIITIIACDGPEPYDPTTEFVINNDSSHYLEITFFNAKLQDNSFDDLRFLMPRNTGENYFYYHDQKNEYPLVAQADSALIVFDNEKQIIYRKNDGHQRNILDIDSWEYKLGVSVKYIYTYTVTDEDYENAVVIE